MVRTRPFGPPERYLEDGLGEEARRVAEGQAGSVQRRGLPGTEGGRRVLGPDRPRRGDDSRRPDIATGRPHGGLAGACRSTTSFRDERVHPPWLRLLEQVCLLRPPAGQGFHPDEPAAQV